jgi:prephenate dehydrogenase (NADP+)
MASKKNSTVLAMEGKMVNFTIGLIGLGDMGKMYANRLSKAGWQ